MPCEVSFVHSILKIAESVHIQQIYMNSSLDIFVHVPKALPSVVSEKSQTLETEKN